MFPSSHGEAKLDFLFESATTLFVLCCQSVDRRSDDSLMKEERHKFNEFRQETHVETHSLLHAGFISLGEVSNFNITCSVSAINPACV